MSIAISVELEPSLRRMLLMAIAPIAFMLIGAIAFLQYFEMFDIAAGAPALGGLCLAMLIYLVRAWKSAKANGKIRLTIAENGEMGIVCCSKGRHYAFDKQEIVQMMQGSTLWPFFILLRLRSQNKKSVVVPFFWGNLSSQQFRRLSLACRWIAARNDIQQSA